MKSDMLRPPDCWRLIVDLSAPVPGELTDWPANIAEPILKAIERDCIARVGWEIQVVSATCRRNHDFPPGAPGAWFLDVQVAEFPTDATIQKWMQEARR